jgi:hypothetical protein
LDFALDTCLRTYSAKPWRVSQTAREGGRLVTCEACMTDKSFMRENPASMRPRRPGVSLAARGSHQPCQTVCGVSIGLPVRFHCCSQRVNGSRIEWTRSDPSAATFGSVAQLEWTAVRTIGADRRSTSATRFWYRLSETWLAE